MANSPQEALRPTNKREEAIDKLVLSLSNNPIMKGVLVGITRQAAVLVDYRSLTAHTTDRGILFDDGMYQEAAMRYAEQHGFLDFDDSETRTWQTVDRKPYKVAERFSHSPRFPHATLVRQEWIPDQDILRDSYMGKTRTRAVVVSQGNVWVTRYLLRPEDGMYYRPAPLPR